MAPDSSGERGAARVLVVDDEPDICEVVKDILEPAGYAVTGFTDARAAIEHLRRRDGGDSPLDAADLALVDLLMPGEIGGAELADDAARLGLRVILMTGAADAAARIEALRRRHPGIVGLPKPFGVAALRQAVREALLARPAVEAQV